MENSTLVIDLNDKYTTREYVIEMIKLYNENVSWLHTYKKRGNLEKDQSEIALRYQNISEFEFLNLTPDLEAMIMELPN